MLRRVLDCIRPPVTVDLEEAVLRLKEVGNLLRQQISKYDGDLNLAIKTTKLSIVRKESKTNQIYYLKRKKLIEHHLASATKRLLAIDQQILTLEGIKMSALHLETVRFTTTTMKKYMKQQDISKVEDLMESLGEYIADATDISNIISEDINPQGLDYDDDSLEKELEELGRNETSWPEVPAHKPEQSSDEDVDDTNPLLPLET
tara:strand:- start:400 stop:1011 length:612 start_codon:yes stop_codon:yes gene_type:complete